MTEKNSSIAPRLIRWSTGMKRGAQKETCSFVKGGRLFDLPACNGKTVIPIGNKLT
ncbi:hypothetical protein [Burkholderia anthina]|uniref:hypothetical protein n=1 Tax=Burkholderia anthina TaxID=179879 RepID=UPI0015893806